MPSRSCAHDRHHGRDRERLEADERDREDEAERQRAPPRRPDAVAGASSRGRRLTHGLIVPGLCSFRNRYTSENPPNVAGEPPADRLSESATPLRQLMAGQSRTHTKSGPQWPIGGVPSILDVGTRRLRTMVPISDYRRPRRRRPATVNRVVGRPSTSASGAGADVGQKENIVSAHHRHRRSSIAVFVVMVRCCRSTSSARPRSGSCRSVSRSRSCPKTTRSPSTAKRVTKRSCSPRACASSCGRSSRSRSSRGCRFRRARSASSSRRSASRCRSARRARCTRPSSPTSPISRRSSSGGGQKGVQRPVLPPGTLLPIHPVGSSS